jgi:SAM-dependent methyltransferase
MHAWRNAVDVARGLELGCTTSGELFMPQPGIPLQGWEPPDDERALLALAGRTTQEAFEANRQQRAQDVAGWCAVSPEKKGFEIGSGEGTVARLLSPSCMSLDCNDISESFLSRARSNCSARDNVKFFLIDHYLDHLPGDSYDFGYSLNVFIHFNVYDIFNYLRAVERVLRTGGVFYFDACTIGPATLPAFREHADIYAQIPEKIRGLLNFNGESVLHSLITEAGLVLSERSSFSSNGWFKVLVGKPDPLQPVEEGAEPAPEISDAPIE